MTRVLIVTGGGRGIGAAIAREAGREGFKVCVNYSRAQNEAEAIAAELRSQGNDAIALQADVSDEEEVEAMFRNVEESFGPVTALVNNAGILHQRPVADMTLDDFNRTMAVNLQGAFLCARAAVRRMSTKSGGSGGVVVNISSISARTGGGSGGVVYAASKGALDSFTIGLAKEVAQEGIRVCAVRPGITETEIFNDGPGLEEVKSKVGDMVPMGRIGQPAEIAALAVWLCSPAASYVTGSLFDVSGGR